MSIASHQFKTYNSEKTHGQFSVTASGYAMPSRVYCIQNRFGLVMHDSEFFNFLCILRQLRPLRYRHYITLQPVGEQLVEDTMSDYCAWRGVF